MSRATVSVVIPVFNGRAWIGEAIESVLNQTTPPLEIIVVDDGSTDGTAQALAGFGERIRVVSQHNQGVAAARNTGMRRSRGELIAFLDADDVWHPRKLEMQGRAMMEHPGVGTLGTRVFNWPIPREEVPSVAGDGGARLASVERDDLATKNYLTVSSVVVRRWVADRVGDFDNGLQGAADHDYWLRAAEVAGVANLEAPLTGYRTVAGSMSRQVDAMEADMRRILGKLDERGWRGRPLRRCKAHSYCCYSCAYMHGAAGKQAQGLWRMAKSIAWYPLPYRRAEVSMSLARLRMLAVLALRLLRLLPEEGAARDAALQTAGGETHEP